MLNAFTVPLSSAKTDAATKGVTIRVTIGVGNMRGNWSSLNYLVKVNFRIKITKVCAHRNAWALVETFSEGRINRKIELTIQL